MHARFIVAWGYGYPTGLLTCTGEHTVTHTLTCMEEEEEEAYANYVPLVLILAPHGHGSTNPGTPWHGRH